MPAESAIIGGGTRKVGAPMDGIRQMVCDQCGRQWDALCYASSERLECPSCGFMVQVPPQTVGVGRHNHQLAQPAICTAGREVGCEHQSHIDNGCGDPSSRCQYKQQAGAQ